MVDCDWEGWEKVGSIPAPTTMMTKHGYTMYNKYGCRCDVCKAAKAEQYTDLKKKTVGNEKWQELERLDRIWYTERRALSTAKATMKER